MYICISFFKNGAVLLILLIIGESFTFPYRRNSNSIKEKKTFDFPRQAIKSIKSAYVLVSKGKLDIKTHFLA